MITLSSILFIILIPIVPKAQYISKYQEIPRIDVHIHVSNNYPGIDNYLAKHDSMIAKHEIDEAIWINLCS